MNIFFQTFLLLTPILGNHGVEAQSLSNPISLADLDGTNGYALNGTADGDQAGFSVASCGDINNDGINDFAIGAPFADSDKGQVYVIFGSSDTMTWPSTLDLISLDGNNGFVLNGIGIGDEAGFSISCNGDVNGDDIDDIVIGAPGNDGQVFVLFGSASPWTDLATLDGSNGFAINELLDNGHLGISVSSGGDINNDGIADIVIGAPGATPPSGQGEEGVVYVIFGSSTGFQEVFSLTSLDTTNGFTLYGAESDGRAGWKVASGGDVNGDGIEDMLIAAPFASPNGYNETGQVFVVFGSSSGFPEVLDLSLLDGTDGFVLIGDYYDDHTGSAVSMAGDIDDDGIDDIVISAPGAFNGSPGLVFVVYGTNSTMEASYDLGPLMNGVNGTLLLGIDIDDKSTGWSVSSGGDVNGDGIADIVIGVYQESPGESGRVIVVLGSENWRGVAEFELSDLNGSDGYIVDGIYPDGQAGWSVSSDNDVNGDDIADIIIGAPLADYGGSTPGQGYVLYGVQHE